MRTLIFVFIIAGLHLQAGNSCTARTRAGSTYQFRFNKKGELDTLPVVWWSSRQLNEDTYLIYDNSIEPDIDKAKEIYVLKVYDISKTKKCSLFSIHYDGQQ